MQEHYFNSQGKSTNVRVKRRGQRFTHSLLNFLWRCAPRLTGWLAMRLFFSPSAYRASTAEKECQRQGRPLQIQVHDKTVIAWRWGRGPAVLLIHGWGGRGIQFHRFVAPLVEAGYSAIAIDMPAHGASTGRITSYFEFTDTLRVFLSKDRGLDVQGIIAHSFGASAAINALVKEKMALNLVCIAPILKLRELLLNTFVRFGIPQIIYTTLISQFEKRYGYNLTADNPWRILPRLGGSVLIVHDEKDRTAAFRDTAEQAQNYAHMTLLATQGLGHRRLLTDETVVQTCLDHIIQQRVAPIVTLTNSQEKKMEPLKHLLKAYASADDEQRLSMFLTHRDLRRDFTKIDMAEAGRPAKALSKQRSAMSGWLGPRRLAGYCRGWLKYCRPVR